MARPHPNFISGPARFSPGLICKFGPFNSWAGFVFSEKKAQSLTQSGPYKECRQATSVKMKLTYGEYLSNFFLNIPHSTYCSLFFFFSFGISFKGLGPLHMRGNRNSDIQGVIQTDTLLYLSIYLRECDITSVNHRPPKQKT